MITVGDQKLDWHEGITISEVLEKIDNTDLCAVVRLNGKLVSSPHFDTTVIPDQSEIDILPPVAGG
ncbi:MAG: sulfur carrier protein ThiS [Desulfobacteraceae bacterium]